MHSKVILFNVKPLWKMADSSVRGGLISSELKYNTRHCVHFFFFFFIFLSIRGNPDVSGYCLKWTMTFSSSLLKPYKTFVNCYDLWVWSPYNVSQKKGIGLLALINTQIKESLCAGRPDILARSASSQHTYYCFLIPSLMCCSCGLISLYKAVRISLMKEIFIV